MFENEIEFFFDTNLNFKIKASAWCLGNDHDVKNDQKWSAMTKCYD